MKWNWFFAPFSKIEKFDMWWMNPTRFKTSKNHFIHVVETFFYYFPHEFVPAERKRDTIIKWWYVCCHMNICHIYSDIQKSFRMVYISIYAFCSFFSLMYPRGCCVGFGENYAYWKKVFFWHLLDKISKWNIFICHIFFIDVYMCVIWGAL